MAANLPMIAGPELLAKLWDTTFPEEPFTAMDPNDGRFRLMAGSVATDWDFAYERLGPKVQLMTGRHDRVFRIDADIAELKTPLRLAIQLEKIRNAVVSQPVSQHTFLTLIGQKVRRVS